MKDYLKPPTRYVAGFVLIVAILTGILVWNRPKPAPISDLAFTQMAFDSLLKGDSQAESFVDFENLWCPCINMNGQPADRLTYLGLQNEEEKAKYRSTFVTKFGPRIKELLYIETLQPWKLESADSTSARLGAHAANDIYLSIELSKRDGEQKIVECGMIMP